MKINYTVLIFIIIGIFMINKHMNKDPVNERLVNESNGDVNKTPFAPLKEKVKDTIMKINEVSPLKIKLGEEQQPVTVITNNYDQVINTKKFEDKKERSGIVPNPEGTTEFRFVDEDPKTAWSTVNVSQHPQHHTSNFEGEKIDTSGFFNQDQFFYDNTSPHSQTNLPDRCTVDANNNVLCNYNDRLQIIPPKLITDAENNLVLNSIGQGKGDIFKTIDSTNVNEISGNNYQVWNYDNEKMINGGNYFGNVFASADSNETFMALSDMKKNYSF